MRFTFPSIFLFLFAAGCAPNRFMGGGDDAAALTDLAVSMDAAVARDFAIVADAAIAPDLAAGPDMASVPFEDYLIQDVCEGGNGLLSDDPYDGCPQGSAQRNLRVGDPLPYHRHDQPDGNNPLGFQRHDSFPRPGPGGTIRYVHPFDFAPFGEYNPASDGYDVSEADGDWAAIVGTRDPGGLAQTFYAPGCAMTDSWLLAPTATYSSKANRVAMLRIAAWEKNNQAFPGACPNGFDAAYTEWEMQSGVVFGGLFGARTKKLDALVSSHYGGANPMTADHIERFYFTRIYGLTRWERWQNNGGVEKPAGCNGPTVMGSFKRVDCRDWSNILPEPLAWPGEAWPTPYADGNLAQNGDFGRNDVTGWNRMGTSKEGAMTNWSLLKDGSGGIYLATNCGGTCTPGQSIYQDIPRGSLGGRFRFGAKIQTDNGNGTGELVVFQRDGQAGIVERDAIPVAPGPAAERFVSPEFTVQPGTVQLRVQFYLSSSHTFRLDDVWIAKSGP